MRIRGDSLRLRLTKTEVAALRERGAVEDMVHFAVAPRAQLSYALQAEDVAAVQARFADGRIVVAVPRDQMRGWVDSEQVGIEAKQPLDDGRSLRVLIEKDFPCGTDRPGEDDSDTFAGPGC